MSWIRAAEDCANWMPPAMSSQISDRCPRDPHKMPGVRRRRKAADRATTESSRRRSANAMRSGSAQARLGLVENEAQSSAIVPELHDLIDDAALDAAGQPGDRPRSLANMGRGLKSLHRAAGPAIDDDAEPAAVVPELNHFGAAIAVDVADLPVHRADPLPHIAVPPQRRHPGPGPAIDDHPEPSAVVPELNHFGTAVAVDVADLPVH